LRPLHGLTALRDLFIADVFSPSEFRDLGSALPLASGEWLDSYRGAQPNPSLQRTRLYIGSGK
jgi:hypothetical protein